MAMLMTRISIYDTTLRDGSQGEGVNFSLQDKLLITQRLDDAGFDYIEGGYPLSNPKDAAYFGAVRDIELKHARVAAFGMTRRREVATDLDQGMKALVAAGTSVITIVGKSWDLHVQDVLGASLEENLRMIADSVGFCATRATEVIYDAEHFFDGYKRNPDYALRTLQAAATAGAAWIVLCDTNGGSLPEEIAEAVLDRVPGDSHSPRHPYAQRRRPGRRQRLDRRAARRAPGPGDSQRSRRALRQCRPLQRTGQPGAQVSRVRGPIAGQAGAPDRALALCLRDSQHEFPPESTVCRHQRFRAQRGNARTRHPQERDKLRAHRSPRPSATSAGSWSASFPASRTSPRS